MKRRGRILEYKLIYTAIILSVYILGRAIPLYGIDTAAYAAASLDAEGILMQAVGGDVCRYSIFALGISPYILATLFVQLTALFRSEDAKARTSPGKNNRISLAVMLGLSVVQALSRVRELKFTAVGHMLTVAEAIAVVEMVTGVMLILWLAERNSRYGIGGRTVLIFANVLDGIKSTVSGHTPGSLVVPVLISLVMLVIVVVMENAEKRIPLQRISIHNIYADKNYLAIKLNPIGVMPVMFTAALFALPQMLVSLLDSLFPNNLTIVWWRDNMTLARPLGIAVYIGCLYVLTMCFSMIFISPKDTTEQFLKSGDSLVDIHAGRDTKRYLRGVMLRVSLFSSTVMGACIGIPLILQLGGGIDSALVMLPTSIMMMTGLWCNLYREIAAVRSYDAYRPFL